MMILKLTSHRSPHQDVLLNIDDISSVEPIFGDEDEDENGNIVQTALYSRVRSKKGASIYVAETTAVVYEKWERALTLSGVYHRAV